MSSCIRKLDTTKQKNYNNLVEFSRKVLFSLENDGCEFVFVKDGGKFFMWMEGSFKWYTRQKKEYKTNGKR